MVFKYEIHCGEGVTRMPEGAQILYVATAPNGPGEGVFAWAEVNAGAPLTNRQIGYFATGEMIPLDAKYVGTAKTPDGAFFWHVFEAANQ